MAILSGLHPKCSQGNKSFPGRPASGWEQEWSLPPPPPVLTPPHPSQIRRFAASPAPFRGHISWQTWEEKNQQLSLRGEGSPLVGLPALSGHGHPCMGGGPSWVDPEPVSAILPNDPQGTPGHAVEKMDLSITSHKLPLGGWKRATKGSQPKRCSSLRCLKSRETKLPGPFRGYRPVYDVPEIQSHKLKAHGTEPRLRSGFPGEKSTQPCV